MENQLVTIASFTKLQVGGFVKEKFEFEGIECFLTDEGFKITNEYVPRGLKLKVRVNDTERAVNVLLKIHKEHDLYKIDVSTAIKDKMKILVPVDLSEYSLNACKYAFGIAEKTSAEIKLLYVYEDPSQNGPVKHTTSWESHIRLDLEEAYNNAQKKLIDFSNDLKKLIPAENQKKAKWHYALLKGIPENVIVALSKRYKPDIILMAPRDKAEKKGMFAGSVTTKVIENTNFPVLTVRKSQWHTSR